MGKHRLANPNRHTLKGRRVNCQYRQDTFRSRELVNILATLYHPYKSCHYLGWGKRIQSATKKCWLHIVIALKITIFSRPLCSIHWRADDGRFRSNEINFSKLLIYMEWSEYFENKGVEHWILFPSIFSQFLFFCLIPSILKHDNQYLYFIKHSVWGKWFPFTLDE